jgi:signal peptidase II
MKFWNIKTKCTFFLIALLIAIADQWIKLAIVTHFAEGQVLPVIPKFFNLVLAYNPGVAFGVFAGIDHDTSRYVVLGITSLIALLAVYHFSNSEIGERPLGVVALAMIIGGAVGNLIDRLLLGKVVDYLDFYYGHYHYPAFNLADSAICVAVVLLLLLPSKAKS